MRLACPAHRPRAVPYLDERPTGLPYVGHSVVLPLVILVVPRVHCLLPIDLLFARQLSAVVTRYGWRPTYQYSGVWPACLPGMLKERQRHHRVD